MDCYGLIIGGERTGSFQVIKAKSSRFGQLASRQLCAQLQTFLTPVSAPVTGRLISPMDRAYLSDNLDSPLLIILRPGQTSVQEKEIAE